MKARTLRIRFGLFVAVLLLANISFAQSSGKVVINEYMPWTSNACGNASEFVELLNFGPGPIDIGCYILTTGVYSVTIPPNTILQPGQFYVIAGQSFIPGTCDNVDSTATGIHASLNWNTCNCTNKPIPSASNTSGMMADDGSSPLVLLDPSLNVIDAVVRSLPGAATGSVTSSSANGCTGKTFNIGAMSINYEELGMAPGNQNSYARSLDGDCNWLKQPSQSGNASNNKSGKGTDISYEFDMVNPTSCDETGKGSVSIYVKHSNYAAIFPMSYTISLDVNNDGNFDFTDQYSTAVDNTPPFIEIDDLPVGHFRVTVFSVKGCYLKNFEFTIIPCNPGTLPVKLVYFKNKGAAKANQELEWLLQDVQNLQSVVVEKATDGNNFVAEKILVNESDRGSRLYTATVEAGSSYRYFRLKITQKSGRSFYSPVLNIASGTSDGINRIWPNPATDKLHIELSQTGNQKLAYCIYNTSGRIVGKGLLPASRDEKISFIPLSAALPPGVYQLQVDAPSGTGQPSSFRFVKH